MELRHVPRSMIVLGANAVGLELAQVFARAGSHVTVIELLDRIVPFEDEAVSEALARYLTEEGLTLVTSAQTQRVEHDGREYRLHVKLADGSETAFEAEELLVATGRRPNTANLGLEAVGVEVDRRGAIRVNDYAQTTNPNVYAAGDCADLPMFVYVAAHSGTVAAENALNGNRRTLDLDALPKITFTDPQVASVGLTEEQAREQGYEVKTAVLPLEHVPKALAARDTRGLIKLVADATTDRLLGAHVVAPEAGEIIQTAVLALRAGFTTEQLATTIFPYLTLVEGLKLAAQTFEKDVAMLSCCAG
jgi:mercuric reductase